MKLALSLLSVTLLPLASCSSVPESDLTPAPQGTAAADHPLVIREPVSLRRMTSQLLSRGSTPHPQESRRLLEFAYFGADGGLRFHRRSVAATVPSVCEEPPPAYRDGAPTCAVLLALPRVVLQMCGGDESAERVLVGLSERGQPLWQRQLGAAALGVEVTGVSADGIVLYSAARGIEVLDAHTGARLLSAADAPLHLGGTERALAFDADNDALYLTEEIRGETPTLHLHRLDVESRVRETLTTLPQTPLPTRVERVVVGEGDRYLYLIVAARSRIQAWKAFAIFDLEKREFVYKRYIYPYGSHRIFLGDGGAVGLQYTDLDGAHVVEHYQLESR